MVANLFFALLGVLVFSNVVGHILMQIRVYRSDSARDRLAWFGTRSGDAVVEAYESLYPNSFLPKIRRWTFMAVLASAAVVVIAVVLSRK